MLTNTITLASRSEVLLRVEEDALAGLALQGFKALRDLLRGPRRCMHV